MKYTRAPAQGQTDWRDIYDRNECAATIRISPTGVPMLEAREWRITHPYDGRPIYTNDPLEADYFRNLSEFTIVPLYAEYEPEPTKRTKRK